MYEHPSNQLEIARQHRVRRLSEAADERLASSLRMESRNPDEPGKLARLGSVVAARVRRRPAVSSA